MKNVFYRLNYYKDGLTRHLINSIDFEYYQEAKNSIAQTFKELILLQENKDLTGDENFLSCDMLKVTKNNDGTELKVKIRRLYWTGSIYVHCLPDKVKNWEEILEFKKIYWKELPNGKHIYIGD